MARLNEGATLRMIGEIVRGEYAEGDVIREHQIVDRFDFSRPVAREVGRSLEARGLLKVRHGRGGLVQPRESWNPLDEDVLAALLSSEHAQAVLAEFLECRRILEVEAAGLAAVRIREAQLNALWAAFERMRARAEEALRQRDAELRYQEADIAFHREILLGAGNSALAALTAPIHRALTSTVSALARPEDRFERGLPEHERILRAVEAGEPVAARDAMRTHLDTVEGYLRDFPS